jgi:hypothetical protein
METSRAECRQGIVIAEYVRLCIAQVGTYGIVLVNDGDNSGGQQSIHGIP